MPRTTIPKKLRKRRVQLGRSLRKAAGISGLSNPRLCQMENDEEVAFLTMSWLTLQRVCKAYDVAFAELNKALERVARRERVL